MRLFELVGATDRNRSSGDLSSSVRLYVLSYFTSRLAEKSSPTANLDRRCMTRKWKRGTFCAEPGDMSYRLNAAPALGVAISNLDFLIRERRYFLRAKAGWNAFT